jgi:hypothetical protein
VSTLPTSCAAAVFTVRDNQPHSQGYFSDAAKVRGSSRPGTHHIEGILGMLPSIPWPHSLIRLTTFKFDACNLAVKRDADSLRSHTFDLSHPPAHHPSLLHFSGFLEADSNYPWTVLTARTAHGEKRLPKGQEDHQAHTCQLLGDPTLPSANNCREQPGTGSDMPY